MNIATDLIERDHDEIADAIDAWMSRPHRSCANDLCTVVERLCRMEQEVLRPIRDAVVPEAPGRSDDLLVLADQIRHTGDRDELRSLVGEMVSGARTQRTDDLEVTLPAMEEALGVARMNALGMDLLEWQHAAARAERESEAELDELLSLTRDELYERAREADLDGRSTMKKVELAEALADR